MVGDIPHLNLHSVCFVGYSRLAMVLSGKRANEHENRPEGTVHG